MIQLSVRSNVEFFFLQNVILPVQISEEVI